MQAGRYVRFKAQHVINIHLAGCLAAGRMCFGTRSCQVLLRVAERQLGRLPDYRQLYSWAEHQLRMPPDCRQMCCWGRWPPRTRRWPRRLLRVPSSRTVRWLQNVSRSRLAVLSHSRIFNAPPAERKHTALGAAAVLHGHSSQASCLADVRF